MSTYPKKSYTGLLYGGAAVLVVVLFVMVFKNSGKVSSVENNLSERIVDLESQADALESQQAILENDITQMFPPWAAEMMADGSAFPSWLSKRLRTPCGRNQWCQFKDAKGGMSYNGTNWAPFTGSCGTPPLNANDQLSCMTNF